MNQDHFGHTSHARREGLCSGLTGLLPGPRAAEKEGRAFAGHAGVCGLALPARGVGASWLSAETPSMEPAGPAPPGVVVPVGSLCRPRTHTFLQLWGRSVGASGLQTCPTFAGTLRRSVPSLLKCITWRGLREWVQDPPSPASDPGDLCLLPGHTSDLPRRGPCPHCCSPPARGPGARLCDRPVPSLPSRSPRGSCRKGRPVPDQQPCGLDTASAEQPWESSAWVGRHRPEQVPRGRPAPPETGLRLLLLLTLGTVHTRCRRTRNRV